MLKKKQNCKISNRWGFMSQFRIVERDLDVTEPCGISHSITVRVLQQRHPIMKRSTTGVISDTPFISGYTEWKDVPIVEETYTER